ncbi:MAG: hypothetical protein R3192_02820 [Woeseiaceae bacterium]|nr:hypothetical protein [Woeseiaceae bacterium]
MSALPRNRWLILGAEGAAIIVSILLAFAIDAWWDQRGERRQEAALLQGLHADFQASQVHLERWLAGNRLVEDAISELLDNLRMADGGAPVTVSGRLILGALSSPTYSPTDSTLRAAMSSGKIELISSHDLRKELAAWDQLLADTSEDELIIRQILTQRLVPVLSTQLRLGYLLDFAPIVGFFMGESHPVIEQSFELRTDSELEAAVAQRLFHTRFVVQGLEDLHESQQRILRMLEPDSRVSL